MYTFRKLTWLTQAVLNWHIERVVETARKRKKEVTTVILDFQFPFLFFLNQHYVC